MTELTNTHIDPPMPPLLLSGDELYDSIMGQIEPELLSANLPMISSLCANETAEQRSARAKRYQAAFKEYDLRFKKHCDEWNQQLHNYKHEAIKYIEQEAKTNEIAELEEIEYSINQ